VRVTNYFECIINTSTLTKTSIQCLHTINEGYTAKGSESWRNNCETDQKKKAVIQN